MLLRYSLIIHKPCGKSEIVFDINSEIFATVLTAICIQAQTANIFARFLRLKRGVYRRKRKCIHRSCDVSQCKAFSYFWRNCQVLMCLRARFSISKLIIYCKSDQTCLHSYFLWLERIIMGLEILKRARRYIKSQSIILSTESFLASSSSIEIRASASNLSCAIGAQRLCCSNCYR
jgi:hypothetical protein